MIDSINYLNFKCFEDRSVSFRPLTVLAGLNSSGKTSVLQGPLLLHQSYQYQLLPGIGLALNGPLASVGAAQDALFVRANEDRIGFEVCWRDSIRANFAFQFGAEADVLDIDAASDLPEEVFETALFEQQQFQIVSA
ncbi:MAG: AAA family ATPase, partial [Bradymonadaceae bacterium]